MATNLELARKRTKVASLPDDLRKLAEEMLNDKFGEEELVQTGRSFQDNCGCDVCTGSHVGYPYVSYENSSESIVDFRGRGSSVSYGEDPFSRQRVLSIGIDRPDREAILRAITQMDYKNIPFDSRKIHMTIRFYKEMLKYGEMESFFGIPVYVDLPNDNYIGCYVDARF